MILRRVIDQFRKQEWTAIFLDFLIVVLGVFIGIQASSWNQQRIDRRDEGIFLEDIHEDIEIVQVLIERLFNTRRENFRKLGELVDVISGEAPAREYRTADCYVIGASDVFYFGCADLPTLIQLRDAGRTNIIKDRKLQKALARLVQRREALEIVIASSDSKVTDFRKKYPQYFHMRSTMVPDISRPGKLERQIVYDVCDAKDLLGLQEARNALVTNIEFYDAFMRDGFIPWTEQIAVVHDRVDELLKITHTGEGLGQ